MLKLQGIYPPITTPFDHNGEIYRIKLIHNVGKWNQTGLAGYVVCGSTGESVMPAARQVVRRGWGQRTDQDTVSHHTHRRPSAQYRHGG